MNASTPFSRVFSGNRQAVQSHFQGDFGLYNKPTKDKVTLSLASLLYGSIRLILRRLFPAVGGGFAFSATAGFAASGLPACRCGISAFLQAIPATDDSGLRTAIYGANGRETPFGGVPTCPMESGFELVFHGGKVCSFGNNANHPAGHPLSDAANKESQWQRILYFQMKVPPFEPQCSTF
jgi:hypothetical protein